MNVDSASSVANGNSAGDSDEADIKSDLPDSAAERTTPTTQRAAARGSASQRKPQSRTSTRKSGAKKNSATKGKGRAPANRSALAKFPRHSVLRALRIPRAILDQNAGRPSSRAEAAHFLGGKATGEFGVEISSAKKYGFLDTDNGMLAITDRAKRALRPQNETDELSAIREAVLNAPDISDVYNYYRGEFLPDNEFFSNALTDTFKIPADKLADFKGVLSDSLKAAQLIDETADRPKLIDIGREDAARPPVVRAGVGARKDAHTASAADSPCFVMQPFSPPYDGYYEALFKPAVIKAGLRPFRADDEIFGAGKIMDQVWRGIREAKVLVAELTTRNANVYYELGLAHALGKPVVLVAADGEEVPFDVHHIRVIYYDIRDPFWGQKLIDKIAENIQSAISNPEEAVLEVR